MAYINKLLTVFDVMQLVAIKLSGKACLLRLQAPAVAGLKGMVHRAAGQLIIDVSPGLEDDLMLKVFLHEVAHAKLHSFEPTQLSSYPSGSIKDHRKSEGASWCNTTQEAQADSLADKWLRWGETHRDEQLPAFEGVLTALLDI